MKRFFPLRYLLIALPALLTWSCYPEGPEYTEDLDLVYTTYDPAYDFQAGATYAMPDKIVVDAEKDLSGNWVPEYMPQSFATPILNQIAANMTALGWTRLPNNAITGEADPAANIALTPAAMKSTNYFYTYWYDWWYGGYYPGYPYYPYYPSYTSYTTGTLVMNLVDPDVTAGDGNSISQWTGALAGMLSYSYDANRANRLIDQAFAQSPYLKTN